MLAIAGPFAAPAIAKILIVFGAMLCLTRLIVHLGLALAAGGFALNLWAARPLADAARTVGEAFLTGELWLLLAITGLIVELGRFLTEGDNAREILAATQRWGGRRGPAWAIMALPAVIGLIPMPAGALFSAPFVEQAGAPIGGTAPWKSAVNYWFRHIWEYWWPLYPGVIIAMSLFGLETWRFIAAELPYTPVAVLAGYFFLIRPHMDRLSRTPPAKGGSNRRALFLLLPVAVTLVAACLAPFLLEALFPRLDVKIGRLLGVLVGLALALILIYADEWRRGKRTFLSALLTRSGINVQLSLTGVLVFKFCLEESGLLPVASKELVESGIPVAAAVATLPFIAGLVTGVAMGFTGTAFPLVVGLLTMDVGLTPLSTLVLAYGFGYVGMMLSPVHLCLLVTKDYFSSPILSVYRLVIPCTIPVLALAVGGHLVLRALGW